MLRSLPSVERLLHDARISALAGAYSHSAVVTLVRSELDAARRAILEGGESPDDGHIVSAVLERAEQSWSPWPGRVINATGVVLHTNLGRAPLSEAAIAAASQSAAGYSDLEFNLSTGKRGHRYSHISELLAQCTGAEAGIAVNNNASGVLLALSAITANPDCPDRIEVIVSRGEAVEIGGGFRVPDVLRQSGAKLVEVGTTNRTYAADYEAAITRQTAAILKVHPSNFTVSGFTHAPELGDLADISKRTGVPLLNDLGSGSLIDTRRYGLEHEPTAQESVKDGAALTMFSGDKLLGGPQAGLIAGNRDLVDSVAKHPLARAVRIDKMTLAALSATLTSYLKDAAEEEVPIWQMISASEESIEQRARRWRDDAGSGTVRSGRSAIGGGSLPGQTLPTTVLAITPDSGADQFCAALRQHGPPVVARIEEGDVVLDPRTVMPGEDEEVVAALKAAGA